MDTSHGDARYWTAFVENCKDGCAGFQLHRERFGQCALVGQTIYWDATGGFVFGVFDGEDVPIEIVEAAITEARERIKIK